MKVLKGLALPALSGILLSLAFPKADISLLAWVAFIPLLYSIDEKRPGRAFMEGFAAGLVFYLVSVRWVINTMYNYGGLGLAVSIILLVALSAYLALYFGVFTMLYSAARSEFPSISVLLAPALWVSLELLRNYALSGFPWNLVGYSQHANLPLIQISDITGVYGVSALVILINAAVTDMIFVMAGDRPVASRRLIAPFASLLILGMAVSYGHWRLIKLPMSSGSMKVSLVQGNIEQFHKWDPVFQQEVFDTYKTLTAAAAESKPDLIIWPETATPFYFQDGLERPKLEEAARSAGTWLMTGSPSIDSAGDGKVIEYNSAYLISPSGQEAGRYDKTHLVPFGEYVPMKALLPFVSKMVTGIGDFGCGRSYTVFHTGKGAFGTAICFEVIFPDLVRKFALEGADFLASITNDAWFGDSAAPYQHFDMSVFRAVENRRTLVRAANTGITGIVLPSGRVARETEIFTRGSITDDIPLMNYMSFYTLHGDVFAYACAFVSSIFSCIVIIRRSRKKCLN